eukprot:COSAG01_NODE_66611_length_269_cov_1.200000_1_plen_69_part_01
MREVADFILRSPGRRALQCAVEAVSKCTNTMIQYCILQVSVLVRLPGLWPTICHYSYHVGDDIGRRHGS